MKNTPNQRLVGIVRRLPSVEAHNRLMGLTDREIAMCLAYMGDDDRCYFLNLLAPAKAGRIEEERRLQKRLNVRYDQYLKTIENVIRKVEKKGGAESFRSYIRPRRR
jgi:hypothetical protein